MTPLVFFPGIMSLQVKENVIYRTHVLFMSMFNVLFNVLNLCPVRRFAIFKKVIDYRFPIVGCFFSCSVAILNLQSVLMVTETNCIKVRIGLDYFLTGIFLVVCRHFVS